MDRIGVDGKRRGQRRIDESLRRGIGNQFSIFQGHSVQRGMFTKRSDRSVVFSIKHAISFHPETEHAIERDNLTNGCSIDGCVVKRQAAPIISVEQVGRGGSMDDAGCCGCIDGVTIQANRIDCAAQFVGLCNLLLFHIHDQHAEVHREIRIVAIDIDVVDRLILNIGIVFQVGKIGDVVAFIHQVDVPVRIEEKKRICRSIVFHHADAVVTQSLFLGIEGYALIVLSINVQRTVGNGKDLRIAFRHFCRVVVGKIGLPGTVGLCRRPSGTEQHEYE